MYALIYKGGSFIGFFSSKKKMRIAIEALIQDQFETKGYHGDYHFQYVKLNVDEPWITKDGNDASKESNAILSLWTIHPEKFIHKVKTDWSTGKIISMDDKSTT